MDITNSITFDLPITYKDLTLYPVYLKDYMNLMTYEQCFLLDKNSIPDAKILTMTELEYLFYLTQQAEVNAPLVLFDRLLGLCLKDNADEFKEPEKSITRFNYDEKGKPYFTIGNRKYNSKDYDELKKIICLQNDIEIPDENVSKEVRDSLDDAKEYKRKISGETQASLEDYIVSLSIVTGWTLEYVYSMSVKKFTKCLRRLDTYIHYKIFLSASMSGMVEFKDKSFIKHWLSGLEDNKYKDVSVELTTIENILSLESAKKSALPQN
jgi:hypothetical protein